MHPLTAVLTHSTWRQSFQLNSSSYCSYNWNHIKYVIHAFIPLSVRAEGSTFALWLLWETHFRNRSPYLRRTGTHQTRFDHTWVLTQISQPVSTQNEKTLNTDINTIIQTDKHRHSIAPCWHEAIWNSNGPWTHTPQPSIHYLICSLLVRVMGGLEPIPACTGSEARIHPGQIANPYQGNILYSHPNDVGPLILMMLKRRFFIIQMYYKNHDRAQLYIACTTCRTCRN